MWINKKERIFVRDKTSWFLKENKQAKKIKIKIKKIKKSTSRDFFFKYKYSCNNVMGVSFTVEYPSSRRNTSFLYIAVESTGSF